jgi:hypothetical protein
MPVLSCRVRHFQDSSAMGAKPSLFQIKNEVKTGTNRRWNKNQNRFYCFKSRSYAVLFQRSKQNQNSVGVNEKNSVRFALSASVIEEF